MVMTMKQIIVRMKMSLIGATAMPSLTITIDDL